MDPSPNSGPLTFFNQEIRKKNVWEVNLNSTDLYHSFYILVSVLVKIMLQADLWFYVILLEQPDLFILSAKTTKSLYVNNCLNILMLIVKCGNIGKFIIMVTELQTNENKTRYVQLSTKYI